LRCEFALCTNPLPSPTETKAAERIEPRRDRTYWARSAGGGFQQA
jgi:hypothetical protein